MRDTAVGSNRMGELQLLGRGWVLATGKKIPSVDLYKQVEREVLGRL